MDVYVAADFPAARLELLDRLRRGEVGVLPTDTLYGLSGDATQRDVVRRIQRLKRRANPPSLIAPSVQWAEQQVGPRHRRRFREQHARYHGAFTMVWPAAGGPLQRTLDSSAIGLRFPEHWVTGLCAELGRPLVSTSVNRTLHPPMIDLGSLDPRIADGIDFLVYEGELRGPASTLVWFTGRRVRVEARR